MLIELNLRVFSVSPPRRSVKKSRRARINQRALPHPDFLDNCLLVLGLQLQKIHAWR